MQNPRKSTRDEMYQEAAAAGDRVALGALILKDFEKLALLEQKLKEAEDYSEPLLGKWAENPSKENFKAVREVEAKVDSRWRKERSKRELTLQRIRAAVVTLQKTDDRNKISSAT